MGTGHRNNKSAYKGIRFPYELVEEIDANVESEKSDNPGANFSAWVLDACNRKLKSNAPLPAPETETESPHGGVLTKQKMKFADCLMKGVSQREAAILAGYSEKSARSKGCQLAKEPSVLAYMASKK